MTFQGQETTWTVDDPVSNRQIDKYFSIITELLSMYHIRSWLRFSPFNIYYICIFPSIVFWTECSGMPRLYSHYCTLFLAGVRIIELNPNTKFLLAWPGKQTDVADILSYLGSCLPKTGYSSWCYRGGTISLPTPWSSGSYYLCALLPCWTLGAGEFCRSVHWVLLEPLLELIMTMKRLWNQILTDNCKMKWVF